MAFLQASRETEHIPGRIRSPAFGGATAVFDSVIVCARLLTFVFFSVFLMDVKDSL